MIRYFNKKTNAYPVIGFMGAIALGFLGVTIALPSLWVMGIFCCVVCLFSIIGMIVKLNKTDFPVIALSSDELMLRKQSDYLRVPFKSIKSVEKIFTSSRIGIEILYSENKVVNELFVDTSFLDTPLDVVLAEISQRLNRVS